MRISGMALSKDITAERVSVPVFKRFEPELKAAPSSQSLSGSKSPSQFKEVFAAQFELQKQMQSVSLTSTVVRALSDSKLSLIRNIKGNS